MTTENPISEEELLELEELERKASDGHWFKYFSEIGKMTIQNPGGWIAVMDGHSKPEDADFIILSRNLLPRLLREFREMKTQKIIMKAQVEGLTSFLLDVQQDCIMRVR